MPNINSGSPYLPVGVAIIGGQPTVRHDIPVCAVLIALYLAGAVGNMTIFQLNRRKGHKFIMSVAMFGLCMSRIITNVLRIVWTTQPNNVRIAIAAQVLTNAGVLILYIVLLLLTLRVFRARRPKMGWNKHLNRTIKAAYFLLFFALVVTVSFTVLTFYTLNMKLRTDAVWIQRSAILYMMIFNITSLTFLILSLILPPALDSENFGTGSMGSKLTILAVAVFFCNFLSGFRTGLIWSATRPASDPAWYDTKPAFYVIIFGFEIVIVYLFLFTRFDRMFWVPNGSSKPGDYSSIVLGETSIKEPEQEKS